MKLKYPYPSRIYCAIVERIVDGDTVIVQVDLGFKVMMSIGVRLARINAPEMNTASGRESKKYLEDILPVDSEVYVICHGKDKYGRWISDICKDRIDETISSRMLADGMAAEYKENL